MPILLNPRHERFAQELAAGKSAAEAYVRAGYKENRHNASALARTKPIKTRLAEILTERERSATRAAERTVERLAITKQSIIDMLIEDRTLAYKVGQAAAAIAAARLIGQELHGMFIERRETGQPGEFATSAERQTAARAVLDAAFGEDKPTERDGQAIH